VDGYDRDFDRAKQDRVSGGGLVSIAYWIVRGVSGLFAFPPSASLRERLGKRVV
jgi:hypothetical protein